MASIGDHLQPDEYFESTICSLYFDTENHDLITNSHGPAIFTKNAKNVVISAAANTTNYLTDGAAIYMDGSSLIINGTVYQSFTISSISTQIGNSGMGGGVGGPGGMRR